MQRSTILSAKRWMNSNGRTQQLLQSSGHGCLAVRSLSCWSMTAEELMNHLTGKTSSPLMNCAFLNAPLLYLMRPVCIDMFREILLVETGMGNLSSTRSAAGTDSSTCMRADASCSETVESLSSPRTQSTSSGESLSMSG